VAAAVVRSLRHPERCLCPLAAVTARVGTIDGILNVGSPPASDVQPGDAFDAEQYPAFSDDDLLAALFGGVRGTEKLTPPRAPYQPPTAEDPLHMHLAEIVSNSVNCVAETNGSLGEGLGTSLQVESVIPVPSNARVPVSSSNNTQPIQRQSGCLRQTQAVVDPLRSRGEPCEVRYGRADTST